MNVPLHRHIRPTQRSQPAGAFLVMGYAAERVRVPAERAGRTTPCSRFKLTIRLRRHATAAGGKPEERPTVAMGEIDAAVRHITGHIPGCTAPPDRRWRPRPRAGGRISMWSTGLPPDSTTAVNDRVQRERERRDGERESLPQRHPHPPSSACSHCFHARHDAVTRHACISCPHAARPFAKPYVWWGGDGLIWSACSRRRDTFSSALHDFGAFAVADGDGEAVDEGAARAHLRQIAVEGSRWCSSFVEGSHFPLEDGALVGCARKADADSSDAAARRHCSAASRICPFETDRASIGTVSRTCLLQGRRGQANVPPQGGDAGGLRRIAES